MGRAHDGLPATTIMISQSLTWRSYKW